MAKKQGTKNDIVYILRNGYDSQEIYYSVRSVCANFPYRKIWFYGGKPEGITPDVMVEYPQRGNTKWERVTNTLKAVCENDDITPDFWLFNDDFFVMKKVKTVEPMIDGTLWARAQRINQIYGGRDTKYSAQIRDTARMLRDKGYDRLNYALHVPMLINRAKGLLTIEEFPNHPMFRSLYGNHHRIGGVIVDDVKVTSEVELPTGDETFLSTDDSSFINGRVGQYIREAFPDKCKYE